MLASQIPTISLFSVCSSFYCKGIILLSVSIDKKPVYTYSDSRIGLLKQVEEAILRLLIW